MIPNFAYLTMQQGELMFESFEPRPPTPGDDEPLMLEHFYWYGWMLARARAVTRIFDMINRVNPDDDKAKTRLVRKLDQEHGLLPTLVSRS